MSDHTPHTTTPSTRSCHAVSLPQKVTICAIMAVFIASTAPLLSVPRERIGDQTDETLVTEREHARRSVIDQFSEAVSQADAERKKLREAQAEEARLLKIEKKNIASEVAKEYEAALRQLEAERAREVEKRSNEFEVAYKKRSEMLTKELKATNMRIASLKKSLSEFAHFSKKKDLEPQHIRADGEKRLKKMHVSLEYTN